MGCTMDDKRIDNPKIHKNQTNICINFRQAKIIDTIIETTLILIVTNTKTP